MNDLLEILTFYKEIGAGFIEIRQPEGRMPQPGIGNSNGHSVDHLNHDSLDTVTQQMLQCTLCGLHKTKKHYVPGEGNPRPDILFIGEGPGETEDEMGRPFVGNAGQLLDKVIEKMGYKREDVYIANIVKCRPPGNREPSKAEADACLPHLVRQIDILKPKIIVCLGRTAMNYLLGGSYSIMEKRGTRFEFNGIPVIPTYHPSYILHQTTKNAVSKAKWEMWEDMQKVLAILKG
ncbi:MAG: uracil-DNA glycosylase [Candidatus Omnitrophota bacterium]